MKPSALAVSLLTVLASSLPYACSTARTLEAPLAEDAQAREVFDDLLARLGEVRHWTLEYTLRAEGAFEADMAGQLAVADGTFVEWSARGTLQGAPRELRLVLDGTHLRMSSTGQRDDALGRRSVLRPDQTVDALVVGFAHMGLLHNLARLAQAEPPERADGGVREWVRGEDFALETVPAPDGRAVRRLSYALVVDGRRAARALLWLDPATGLPFERVLEVSFGCSGMTARETYRWSAE